MEGPQVLSKRHVDALTGLRFLAAMAVYLHHQWKPNYLPDWLTTFLNSGYNGVTFFFVLSGFVIGLNYFDALVKPTWRDLVRYAGARLARVYPLYFLVLLFVWLDQGAPQDRGILVHFLALQTWSPDVDFANAFNGPGWSIGVEFFLYASFPLIVLALAPIKQHRKLLWLLALGVTMALLVAALYFHLSGHAAGVGPESAHRWLYRTPVTRLGDFLLGVIAALLFSSHKRSSEHSESVWAWLTYASTLGIVLLMLWPDNYLSAFSWDVAYAPLAYLLILGLALAPQTHLGRFLGSHRLVVLGEASFALYLVHVPMMNTFGVRRYLQFEPLVTIALWTIFTAICILLSMGLNVYVETPIRHALNNWITRLTRVPRLG